jgi:Tfp pilus assembly protein PilF
MVAVHSRRTGAIVLAWLALSAVLVPAAPVQLNMARLLDRYGSGEFEAVARTVVEAVASDSRALLPELQTGGQRWIGRGETGEIRRARRLIAAALALEAAGSPRYVGTSRGLTLKPEVQTIPRFEGRPFLPSFERRALVAWAAGQVLDLSPADAAVDRAVAPGQVAGPLDEAERRWFLAAIALLAGAGDVGFLAGSAPPARPGLAPGALSMGDPGTARWLPRGGIVPLARKRFPDEPRFKLAEVFLEERRTTGLSQGTVLSIQTQTPEDGVIPERLLRQRTDPHAVSTNTAPTLRELVAAGFGPAAVPQALALLDVVGAGYEALGAEHEIRAEALVRLGYHYIRVGDRQAAIDTFSRAIDEKGDSDLQYLAFFFRGWTLHRSDRREAAARDYEQALAVRPASRQVRALLASLMADRGDRETAREVLGEFLSRTLSEVDPWFLFHRGEYRLFAPHVAALREALR